MRNWYVITGGPSAGKTTLIEALEKAGYHVEHESARLVIDEALVDGKTVEDIRADEQKFQDTVFQHKLDRERRLNPDELIFFDRGMQDTDAYHTLHGFPISSEQVNAMNQAEYQQVFLLEPFSFEEDYARTESAHEAERLFDLLKEAYQKSQTPLTIIPCFPTKEERIEYFFNLLLEYGVIQNTPEHS